MVPRWFLVSGISPEAVALYCFYKLWLDRNRTSNSAIGIPQTRRELVAALHLDSMTQFQAVHQRICLLSAL